MSKTLAKFYFISFFMFTFHYPAHGVTHKQAQLASISAGTATGLCLAAAILYGSYKFRCDNQANIKACAAGGISSALLTYFLIMKILEKYTPEYVLQAVKNKFEDIKQDALANQSFVNDEDILKNLKSKLGKTFAMEESVTHLKNLRTQTNKLLEDLDQIKDDAKSSDLINTYQKLKDSLLIFDQIINTKIAQLTIAFVKMDTDPNSDALNKHLKSLNSVQEIISKLVSKIPRNKIFDDTMATLKTQNDKIEDLKVLIQLKLQQALIESIEKDYFVHTEFETDDNLAYAIATKFDSPWFLVLAKKNFAIYKENLDHVSENLTSLIKFIQAMQENPNMEQSVPNHELEFYNHLQEKIIFLNKKLDTLMMMIVKNENYTNQIKEYEQNLLAKKQIDILENQRILMEKHIDNDKKVEAAINNLIISQNSKFQEIKSYVDKLENKIKDYDWKIESRLNQLERTKHRPT